MNFDNINFGMRGHDVGNSFDEMLENATKHGVPNLQFALAKTVSDVKFDEVGYDKEISKKIADKLSEHNLTVSVLGCYINPIDRNETSLETQLTRFENFIRYAKDFGAHVIATETGALATMEETRSEENYQFLLKNIKRLVEVAEKEGVMMAIEPVKFFTIYSPQIMRRLIDDVNSDNLKVVFDLSNLITADNTDEQYKLIDDAFDLLGDKIYAVHIKDYTVEDGIKKFAVAGTGMYDIKYLFEKMSKLSSLPHIILDEIPLIHYAEAKENIKNIIK